MTRKLYSTIVPLVAVLLGALAAGIVVLPKAEFDRAPGSERRAGVYEKPCVTGSCALELPAR